MSYYDLKLGGNTKSVNKSNYHLSNMVKGIAMGITLSIITVYVLFACYFDQPKHLTILAWSQPQLTQGLIFLQKYKLYHKILPQRICRNGLKVNVFIFIFSRRSNVKERDIIRETWLDMSIWKRHEVQYIFIIGQSNQNTTRDADLLKEAHKHEDILISNFIDTFDNLTLKAVIGLHTAVHFCPNAMFTLKTDDDTFLNMFLLQNMLKTLIGTNHTKHILMGYLFRNEKVRRKGKYAVTRQDNPDKYYPNFLSGIGYIMSMDVTKSIYNEAKKDSRTYGVLPFDDVYLTGILAQKSNITHISIRSKYAVTQKQHFYKTIKDKALKEYLFLQLHDKEITGQMFQMHKQLWFRLKQFNK